MTPEEVRDVIAAYSEQERQRTRRELSNTLLIVNHIRGLVGEEGLTEDDFLVTEASAEADDGAEGNPSAFADALDPAVFKQLSQDLDDRRQSHR